MTFAGEATFFDLIRNFIHEFVHFFLVVKCFYVEPAEVISFWVKSVVANRVTFDAFVI